MKEVDVIDVISYEHSLMLSTVQNLGKSYQHPLYDFQLLRGYLNLLNEFLNSRDHAIQILIPHWEKIDFELEEMQKVKKKILISFTKFDVEIIKNDSFKKYLRTLSASFKRYINLERKFLFNYFRNELTPEELKEKASVYLDRRSLSIYEVTTYLLKTKKTKTWITHPADSEIFH